MERHADCQDGCLLKEAKGYRDCLHASGECDMLRSEQRSAEAIAAARQIEVELEWPCFSEAKGG